MIETIFEEMTEQVARQTGVTPRKTEEMGARLYALAAQLAGLYAENQWTRDQCFPQTAVGEELDKHAWLRGLTRQPAARALGTLRFSLPAATDHPVTIPAGTVCKTEGLVAFETTQEGTIPAGKTSGDVPARAAEPGAGGNVSAGTVQVLTVAPEGVTKVINPAPFTGGWEQEEDADLRARILATYRVLPNGTNRAFYESETLGIEGVAAVRVLPKHRGLGTVDVVITSPAGVPDQALLDRVKTHLAQCREVAVDVAVLAPETVAVNVAVQVQVKGSWNAGRAKVKAALSSWFDGTRLGQSVLLAELAHRLYMTEGVENYKLVLPNADVAIGESQLPVIGTLVVEELL